MRFLSSYEDEYYHIGLGYYGYIRYPSRETRSENNFSKWRPGRRHLPGITKDFSLSWKRKYNVQVEERFVWAEASSKIAILEV